MAFGSIHIWPRPLQALHPHTPSGHKSLPRSPDTFETLLSSGLGGGGQGRYPLCASTSWTASLWPESLDDFLLILPTQVRQHLLWAPRELCPCPNIELLTAKGKFRGSSPRVGAIPPPRTLSMEPWIRYVIHMLYFLPLCCISTSICWGEGEGIGEHQPFLTFIEHLLYAKPCEALM